MDVSEDYRDLFKILNKHRVRYLVVGAYAVGYYIEPRFTKDLDIWVSSEKGDVNGLYKALKEFGAPLKNVSPEDFINKKMIYQIGVAPIRVDIIMGLPGMKFASAWRNRTKSKYGNATINIIGIKDLMKLKKNSGRLQDYVDLEKLMELFKKTKSSL